MRASRQAGILLIILIAVGGGSTAAIVATYSRLSHTWDEGAHVLAGVEWLQDGRYTFETQNPPLSRVPLAVIPYLNGARMPPPEQRQQGTGFAAEVVYYQSPGYVRNVTEGRVANLLFFWACIALSWVLAGGRRDPWVACFAGLAVATLPPIVAHSGFATTDIPFLASFLLALISLRRLLVRPSMIRAAVAGVTLGIAVATKFSALVFLPPAALAILAVRYWDERRCWAGALLRPFTWKAVLLIGGVCAVTVWAAYGFNVGRLSDLPTRFGPYGDMPTEGWPATVRDWPLPAHEFIHGLLYLKAHATAGHPSTLFDQFSRRGFLLYYPVLLATKTPLPFLVFAAVGFFGLARVRDGTSWGWGAGLALGALGVLLVALTSPINIGVRHVLVIYPLAATAAAFGVVRLAERGPRRRLKLALAGGCLALQAALLWASVPNQVTYFNLFAGSEPAYIASDSDYDWGQHALALETYFAQHPVPELYVLLNGTAKTCELKLPPVKQLPSRPVTGWIAVSEREFRLNRGQIREDPCALPGMPGKTFQAPPGWLNWLKAYKPVAIIGKTVRLYHVPESDEF